MGGCSRSSRPDLPTTGDSSPIACDSFLITRHFSRPAYRVSSTILSVSSNCQTRRISITSYWRATSGGKTLYGA